MYVSRGAFPPQRRRFLLRIHVSRRTEPPWNVLKFYLIGKKARWSLFPLAIAEPLSLYLRLGAIKIGGSGFDLKPFFIGAEQQE